MLDKVYAILSSVPIFTGGDGYTLLVSLPLNDKPDCMHYVSLVIVHDGCKVGDVLDDCSDSLPYAYQYISFFGDTEVATNGAAKA